MYMYVKQGKYREMDNYEILDTQKRVLVLLTFHIEINRASCRSQFIGGLTSICTRILGIYGQHVQRCKPKVAGSSIPVTGG